MKIRAIVVIVALCLAFATVPATASAQTGNDPSGTTHPAVITLSAGTAEFHGSGDDRRLILEAVAPTIATFDADAFDPAPLPTWSAVDFLLTRPSVVAVVRPVEGVSEPGEAERLRLSKLDYDAPTGELTAEARPVAAGKVPSPLSEAAGPADTDGKLPSGPVELLAFDDDTKTTSDGEPLPTARMTAQSSYEIPVNLVYEDGDVDWTVHGTATNPYCANTNHFTVDVPRPDKHFPTSVQVTTFSVDTNLGCITRLASVTYEITVNGQKATDLTIQQVGPRTFWPSCPNNPPFFASCGYNWSQVQLRMHQS